MAISDYVQSISERGKAAWNTLSDSVHGVGLNAYKISNYMLGGVFRNLLLDAPSHTQATRQTCQQLLNPDISIDNAAREQILKTFRMRTERWELQIDRSSYLLEIKIYESLDKQDKHTCIRVGGKDETQDVSDARVYPLLKAYVQTNRAQQANQGLRILQFCLHGHQTKSQGEPSWSPWKPAEARELSRIFLAFLKDLQETLNIPVHSLICCSMGSLVFEDLDAARDALPKLLLLDRPLTSVWKVASKLYNPVVAYMLYGGAYIAGWAADPEKSLTRFFANLGVRQAASMGHRKVVIIEVKEDWYFSGSSAFSDRFTTDLNQAGIRAHRERFHPNEILYHARSHHALPLNKLRNNHKQDDTSILPLQPHESAAAGIIKYLMLPDQPYESAISGATNNLMRPDQSASSDKK